MKTQNTLLLHLEDSESQARSLASALAIRHAQIELHRFPDDESVITLPKEALSLSEENHIILFLSLDHPNSKLIELMLACQTLREQHCHHIVLLAPYLCYMRQDIAFKPGDAVSQKIIGRFLAQQVDTVITVDPHLHRTPVLKQAVPANQAICLSSAQLQADYIQQHYPDAILVGPDAESEQWVSGIARHAGNEFIIATKQRFGDRHVKISLPETALENKTCVIIDDMASTGHTLAECARALVEAQANCIHAIVTHALFGHETEQLLIDAGIQQTISTDSISHPSNRISLTPLLADAIRKL